MLQARNLTSSNNVINLVGMLLIFGMLVSSTNFIQSIKVNLLGLAIIKAKWPPPDLISSNELAVDDVDIAAQLTCRFPTHWATMPEEFQDDVQSQLEECLRANSGRPEQVRLGLLLSLEKQENPELVARLLQHNDDLVLHLLNLSVTAIEDGDSGKALDLLDLLQGHGKHLSTLAFLRGRVHAILGDDEIAREFFEEALERNDYHTRFSNIVNRYTALYELGRFAAAQEKWDLAVSSFKQATEVNPENPYAWMRLGLVHFNGLKNTDEAEFALRKSLENGDIDWAHFGLGRVLEAQGREVEAMVEMLAAFRITRFGTFRDELLALLSRTIDSRAALSTYAEMVQLAPDDPIILSASAERLAEVGEIKRAIELYEEALAIEEERSWLESLETLTNQLQEE